MAYAETTTVPVEKLIAEIVALVDRACIVRPGRGTGELAELLFVTIARLILAGGAFREGWQTAVAGSKLRSHHE